MVRKQKVTPHGTEVRGFSDTVLDPDEWIDSAKELQAGADLILPAVLAARGKMDAGVAFGLLQSARGINGILVLEVGVSHFSA